MLEQPDVTMTNGIPIKLKTMGERAEEAFLRKKAKRTEMDENIAGQVKRGLDWDTAITLDKNAVGNISTELETGIFKNPKQAAKIIRQINKKKASDATDKLLSSIDDIYNDTFVNAKTNFLEQEVKEEMRTLDKILDPESTPDQIDAGLAKLKWGETIEDAKKLKALLTDGEVSHRLRSSAYTIRSKVQGTLNRFNDTTTPFKISAVNTHKAAITKMAYYFMTNSKPNANTAAKEQLLTSLGSIKIKRVLLFIDDNPTIKFRKFKVIDSTREHFCDQPAPDIKWAAVKYNAVMACDNELWATSEMAYPAPQWFRVTSKPATILDTVTTRKNLPELARAKEAELNSVTAVVDLNECYKDYTEHVVKASNVTFIIDDSPLGNMKGKSINLIDVKVSEGEYESIVFNGECTIIGMEVIFEAGVEFFSDLSEGTIRDLANNWSYRFSPEVMYLQAFRDLQIIPSTKPHFLKYLGLNDKLYALYCNFAKAIDAMHLHILTTTGSLPYRLGDKRKFLKPFVRALKAGLKLLPYWKANFGTLLNDCSNVVISVYDDWVEFFKNPPKALVYYFAEPIVHSNKLPYGAEEMWLLVSNFSSLLEKRKFHYGIDKIDYDKAEALSPFVDVLEERITTSIINPANFERAITAEIEFVNTKVTEYQKDITELNAILGNAKNLRQTTTSSDEKLRTDGLISSTGTQLSQILSKQSNNFETKNALELIRGRLKLISENLTDKKLAESLTALYRDFLLVAQIPHEDVLEEKEEVVSGGSVSGSTSATKPKKKKKRIGLNTLTEAVNDISSGVTTRSRAGKKK